MDPVAENHFLISWQTRADQGEWLAEAVVSMEMSMLVSEAPEVLRSIWSRWLVRRDLSNSPVWDSATVADTDLQTYVAAHARQVREEPSGAHEIHLLLRFLRRAHDEAISGTDRLKLLQPHYRAIGETGLGEHFLQVVLRAISLEQLDHVAPLTGILLALDGVETTGVVDDVVEALAKMLVRDRSAERVLEDVTAVLPRLALRQEARSRVNAGRLPRRLAGESTCLLGVPGDPADGTRHRARRGRELSDVPPVGLADRSTRAPSPQPETDELPAHGRQRAVGRVLASAGPRVANASYGPEPAAGSAELADRQPGPRAHPRGTGRHASTSCGTPLIATATRRDC